MFASVGGRSARARRATASTEAWIFRARAASAAAFARRREIGGHLAHRRVEDGEDLERVGRMAASVAPDLRRSLAAAQRPAERGPGPRVSGGVLQRGEKRPQARGRARFGAGVAGTREGAGGFQRLARHEHRQDNGFEATMGA